MPVASKPIANPSGAKKATRQPAKKASAKKPKAIKHKALEKGPVPVTLLSGFLGAGKTTLLEHILKNKEGLRCAVVVNDMAEINIDSSLLKGTRLLQTKEQVVELQNGCICCTLREDLLLALREMALSNKFDVIVIESTGVAEPMQVAETFYIDPEDGNGPLYSLARLDNCVTVVDASTFYDNLNSCDIIKDQEKEDDDSTSDAAEDADAEEDEVEEDGDSGNISHLLIEQVEFANVILLNKTDLVPADRIQATLNLLRTLNPTAKIVCTRNSQIDVRDILFTGRFTEAFAQKAAGWMADILTDIKHTPETLEYGIGHFVYRSNKPFHPARLCAFLMKYFLLQEVEEAVEGDEEEGSSSSSEEEDNALEEGAPTEEEEQAELAARQKAFEAIGNARRTDLGNLFRSKGYLWVGTPDRHASFGEWNHAGNMLRFNYAGEWSSFPGLGGAKEAAEKATHMEETSLTQRAAELANAKKASKGNSLTTFFHEKAPCQEIVMIGQDLKRDVITRLLDECLLTGEEEEALVKALENPVADAPKLFEDPFEPWVVAGPAENEMEGCPLQL